MDTTPNDMNKTLLRTLRGAFTDHPREAGESYWQHFVFTVDMARRLFVVCILLLAHGILPFTLTHAASSRLQQCQKILTQRAARTGYNEMCDGFGI
jgi:hypothetical protein